MRLDLLVAGRAGGILLQFLIRHCKLPLKRVLEHPGRRFSRSDARAIPLVVSTAGIGQNGKNFIHDRQVP